MPPQRPMLIQRGNGFQATASQVPDHRTARQRASGSTHHLTQKLPSPAVLLSLWGYLVAKRHHTLDFLERLTETSAFEFLQQLETITCTTLVAEIRTVPAFIVPTEAVLAATDRARAMLPAEVVRQPQLSQDPLPAALGYSLRLGHAVTSEPFTSRPAFQQL